MCSQQIEGTDDEKDKYYITGCPLLHVTQHEIQGPLKYFPGPFLADSRTFCSICYSTFLRLSVFTSFFFKFKNFPGFGRTTRTLTKHLVLLMVSLTIVWGRCTYYLYMPIITFSVLAEPKRGGGELPNIETAPAGNYSQTQKRVSNAIKDLTLLQL